MLVGGFDPAQVRAAIDERDERLVRLEREAKALAQRVIDAERRIQAAQGRKGAADEPGQAGSAADDESNGPIESIARRIEEIHAQARRQATRIRMAALEDAVQITDRIGELTKLREELSGRVSELAGMAGIKLGAGEESGATFGRAPAAATNGAPPNGVYRGPVYVELGPLRDFAQVSLFQDAAAGIGAASEIRVTRVSKGRATVSMNLDSPVELLRELEERAPFEFKVRDTRGDGVVLDIDDADTDDRRAA